MGAVIRADGHHVTAGDDLVLGRRATVHIAHGVYPTVIGMRVAAGRNAIIHACAVGNRVVIGENAIILDGSVLGDDLLLAPDAVVFPRSQLEGGYLYAGSPARPVRRVRSGEIEAAYAAIRDAVLHQDADDDAEDDVPGSDQRAAGRFFAPTARRNGAIELAAGASVFFGCELDAGAARISIGRDSNIQDNSVLRGDVTIGADSTLGHNVTVESSHIGGHSLIGMGAILRPGTIVADDVLLAAGAETGPGQTLEGGWLWGGRPAVRMKPLDAARRVMMRETIRQYCEYADSFRQIMSDGSKDISQHAE